ncbi:MAG: DUF4097 domain-containing protein [Clostridiales bacterium]|jgi:hypothetical protein|nr:DUF4097 domain-containing protein [Clostridiales bacterium]
MKRLKIIGGVIIAAGLTLLLISIPLGVFDADTWRAAAGRAAEKAGYYAEPVLITETLSADTADFDLRLEARFEIKADAETEDITLKYYEVRENQYEFSNDGGKLVLKEKSRIFNFYTWNNWYEGLLKYSDYVGVITVPSGFKLDSLSLSTLAGTVDITGINVRSFDLKCSAGAVNVVGGAIDELDVRLSSGEVTFSDTVTVGTAKVLEVSSGDLSLNGVVGTIDEIKVSSGDAYIKRISGTGSAALNIKVSSGNLTLDAVEYGAVNINLSSGDVKLNNAAVKKITLNVSSGDLDIDTVYVAGQVSLAVKKSSGTVKFFGERKTENTVAAPECAITGNVSSGTVVIL